MISVLAEGNLLRDPETRKGKTVWRHRRKQSSRQPKRPATASSQMVFIQMCDLLWFTSLTLSYLSFPRVLQSRNYFNSKAVSYISVQNQRLAIHKAGNEIGIRLRRHYSDLGPDPACKAVTEDVCHCIALHGKAGRCRKGSNALRGAHNRKGKG